MKKKVKNSVNRKELSKMVKKEGDIVYNDKYVAIHYGNCIYNWYNQAFFGKGKMYE